jgi:hypothetical protein
MLDNDTEPCGENDCYCHCVSQHGPCGCDCPRYMDEAGSLVLADDE